MISGAHAIIYSTDAEADRAFLRDVFELPHVDVGDGWLIFSLPPSEVAVQPFDRNDRHELYFLVNDVEAFVREMGRRKVRCSPLHQESWGRVTEITLPGGGTIGVYQPRHASKPMRKTASRAKEASAR
jgi:hypothetical protein